VRENPYKRVSLPYVVAEIQHVFPGLQEVYIFGSRRFRTGSVRSDIDLLLVFEGSVALPVLGTAAYQIEPYVDVFISRGQSAVSAINGSIVTSSTSNLIQDLAAEQIWRAGEWVGPQEFEEHDVLSSADPIPTMLTSGVPQKTINIPPLCDYLIVTALQEEFEAVRNEVDEVSASAQLGTVPPFALARVATTSGDESIVALCTFPRLGLVSAALTTRRLLDYLSPRLVLLVGIAGGIASDDLSLGDIVLPGEIYEYEAVKVTPAGERNNALIAPVAADAYAAIKMWHSVKWIAETSASMPDNGRTLSLHFDGAMASGQKVIADAERAQALTMINRKTSSIDMESFGVAEACRQSAVITPLIVIKAISDYADEAKDDRWHAFCCAAAASLAIQLIRENVI
jgi:nucleoside phosphorylase